MKKVIYFIGAYGCGKTTKVLSLRRKSKEKARILTEDDYMLTFLKMPDKFLRQQFYLFTMYYRLHKAIEELLEDDKAEVLLVDGHPLLNLVYGRVFFEMYNGLTLNYLQLTEISKAHWHMNEFAKKTGIFEGLEQTLCYIDLPFDVNMGMIYDRNRNGRYGNPEEIDEDFLLLIKRVLSSEITYLSQMYRASVVNINSIKELDEYKPKI